jgi:hypothetical protein
VGFLKWKLMLTTLPLVVLVLAVKLALELGAGFSGVVEFSDISVVLTGGVFLTGFMLAGTMADYKESEKLPGELACLLETLEEVALQAAAGKATIDGPTQQRAVLALTDAIRGWLQKRLTQVQLFEALTTYAQVLRQLERDGGGAWASRGVSELHNLRKALTRVAVISRTGFLPPAYALLETLTAIILVLILAAKFKSTLAECILVPFVTLIYVYMLRLIRDIDDPFDYAPDGSRAGAAEVELFPLEEFHARLAARLK